MDKLNFTSEVVDIKWPTNTRGTLHPVLVLDQEFHATKGDDSRKFDGIALTNMDTLQGLGCGVGSKIDIRCNDDLIPQIEAVSDKSKVYKTPVRCMYCKGKTNKHGSEFLCLNHLCHAQSRTPIFKLFMASTLEPMDRARLVDTHLWLNSFPTNGDYMMIENFYQFLKAFKAEIRSIGSDARRDQLLHVVGKGGGGIYLYEIAIKQSLVDGLKPNQFWYLLSLPFTQKDFDKIADHNIFKESLKKAPKLSEHGKAVLADNASYIKMIKSALEDISE